MDQQVVDEGRLRVHETGVLDSADRQLGVVVARHTLHELERSWAANDDLAHVRHVEQTRPVADRNGVPRPARCTGRASGNRRREPSGRRPPRVHHKAVFFWLPRCPTSTTYLRTADCCRVAFQSNVRKTARDKPEKVKGYRLKVERWISTLEISRRVGSTRHFPSGAGTHPTETTFSFQPSTLEVAPARAGAGSALEIPQQAGGVGQLVRGIVDLGELVGQTLRQRRRVPRAHDFKEFLER